MRHRVVLLQEASSTDDPDHNGALWPSARTILRSGMVGRGDYTSYGKFRVFLLRLPRRQKRLQQVATDCLLVWLALWLAFIVRLGIDDMYNPLRVHFWLFACAPLIAIPLYIRFGIYRAVMMPFAIIKTVCQPFLFDSGPCGLLVQFCDSSVSPAD